MVRAPLCWGLKQGRERERESKWTIHQLIHQPCSRAPHWFEIPRPLHHASFHSPFFTFSVFILVLFRILLHQRTLLLTQNQDRHQQSSSTDILDKVYKFNTSAIDQGFLDINLDRSWSVSDHLLALNLQTSLQLYILSGWSMVMWTEKFPKWLKSDQKRR